jgi:precorrin-3B synthase
MSATVTRRDGRPPEAPRRKGWCPGALRPMETGDGLLARVRASGGRLTLDQAEAIADCAFAHGNGAIALSARGNLQIRGVREATLAELQASLDAAGLLDADPEVERVRNIVASPLSEFDPAAAFDLVPCVEALEARLATDPALRRLPEKFSFVLDAGGALPLGDVDGDVRFEADGRSSFAVFLAGDDALAASCPAARIGEAASRLAQAFLAGADAGTRMRGLVARVGAKPIFAGADMEAHPRVRSKRRARLRDILGLHVFGESTTVGAAAPFGRLEAIRLKALVANARLSHASGLRLTPWRAVVAVGLAPSRAGAFLTAAEESGFIVRADDLRLRVVACPGAPACLHGHAPLDHDATRWADLLPEGDGVLLHVSGCAKGCARPFATPLTLVATPAGYDLVIKGKPGDEPARRSLTVEAVGAFLADERDRLDLDHIA